MPRPYSASDFRGFLESDLCFLCQVAHGFALGRVVADEAELLTLAVDPDLRRQGLGSRLLTDFETAAQNRGGEIALLEVAAGNTAAVTLYGNAGYAESGRRKGYYRHPDGRAEDAILMEKRLIRR